MTRKEAEKHLERLARRRERYAERKKVARTPREPEQLALPFENRLTLRLMTPEAKAEMERDAKNIGRAWIKKIRASMEG